MKNIPLFNSDYHKFLISVYVSQKALYSFSLKERVDVDLGNTLFQINKYTKELECLSDEELSDKINTLKAPWWNDIYENKFKHNKKRLVILSIILNIKRYGFQDFKLLCRVIKTPKEQFE